jgi:hypothetical protein
LEKRSLLVQGWETLFSVYPKKEGFYYHYGRYALMLKENKQVLVYPEELISFVKQHHPYAANIERTKALLSLVGSLPMDFDEDKQMESKLKDYESHAWRFQVIFVDQPIKQGKYEQTNHTEITDTGFRSRLGGFAVFSLQRLHPILRSIKRSGRILLGCCFFFFFPLY